jgi:hypothetical protein
VGEFGEEETSHGDTSGVTVTFSEAYRHALNRLVVKHAEYQFFLCHNVSLKAKMGYDSLSLIRCIRVYH